MRTSTLMLVLLFAGITFGQGAMMDSTVTVTVTNTSSQVISPPILVSHDGGFHFFTPGEAATPELALLAEDGDATELATISRLADGVHAVTVADGPLVPGASVTLEIAVSEAARYLSLAGMLITTNDAFFVWTGTVDAMTGEMMDGEMDGEMMDGDAMDGDAMDGDDMEMDAMMDDADAMKHAADGVARVYDAGTEANTESCAHIPGPPCGHALVRVTDGAEGVVSPHEGILGIADLDPAILGWTDPVVTVHVAH
ncbi:MAG: spondin domain-containing protein [Trueperaceae bacterium]|nr:spondin domain-containing protein [Trueperaceae bacterium]